VGLALVDLSLEMSGLGLGLERYGLGIEGSGIGLGLEVDPWPCPRGQDLVLTVICQLHKLILIESTLIRFQHTNH
jgi:hypothetical protein